MYDEDSHTWKNEGLVLDDLSDVTITTPSEGEAVTYDSTDAQWKNTTS